MNNPWLSIPHPETNLNVLRVDGDSPIDAFWAVDPTGEFLFLVEGLLPDPTVTLPDLDAIQSAVAPSCEGVRLFLKLQDKSDWELFFALCSDISRALRASGAERGLATVAARFEKWRDFLRFRRHQLLSAEQIRGLFAELTLLETRLAPAIGWHAAVAAWGGPAGMPRDFSFAGMAVEVKAKLSGSRREVRISSEDQLAHTTSPLFLHVVTLAVAEEGHRTAISLADRVRRVREAVASDATTADAFEDLLLLMGYVDTSAYSRDRFSVEAEDTFNVREGFPKIVPSILPAGVRHVSYGIDLQFCEPFRVGSDWLVTDGKGV